MKELITLEHENGNVYRVCGDNVRINMSGDGEDTVQIDNPVVTINDVPSTRFGFNFLGHHFTVEEAAQWLIRAFINDNREFKAPSPSKIDGDIIRAWFNIFEPVGIDTKLDNRYRPIRTISKKYLDSYSVLDLQMVSEKNFSYYSDGDSCVLIRNDGSLATESEFRYENEFIKDVENKSYLYLAEEMMPET